MATILLCESPTRATVHHNVSSSLCSNTSRGLLHLHNQETQNVDFPFLRSYVHVLAELHITPPIAWSYWLSHPLNLFILTHRPPPPNPKSHVLSARWQYESCRHLGVSVLVVLVVVGGGWGMYGKGGPYIRSLTVLGEHSWELELSKNSKVHHSAGRSERSFFVCVSVCVCVCEMISIIQTICGNRPVFSSVHSNRPVWKVWQHPPPLLPPSYSIIIFVY